MYYLEERRYYSCFLHGSIKTGGLEEKTKQHEKHIEIQKQPDSHQFVDKFPFFFSEHL